MVTESLDDGTFLLQIRAARAGRLAVLAAQVARLSGSRAGAVPRSDLIQRLRANAVVLDRAAELDIEPREVEPNWRAVGLLIARVGSASETPDGLEVGTLRLSAETSWARIRMKVRGELLTVHTASNLAGEASRLLNAATRAVSQERFRTHRGLIVWTQLVCGRALEVAESTATGPTIRQADRARVGLMQASHLAYLRTLGREPTFAEIDPLIKEKLAPLAITDLFHPEVTAIRGRNLVRKSWNRLSGLILLSLIVGLMMWILGAVLLNPANLKDPGDFLVRAPLALGLAGSDVLISNLTLLTVVVAISIALSPVVVGPEVQPRLEVWRGSLSVCALMAAAVAVGLSVAAWSDRVEHIAPGGSLLQLTTGSVVALLTCVLSANTGQFVLDLREATSSRRRALVAVAVARAAQQRVVQGWLGAATGPVILIVVTQLPIVLLSVTERSSKGESTLLAPLICLPGMLVWLMCVALLTLVKTPQYLPIARWVITAITVFFAVMMGLGSLVWALDTARMWSEVCIRFVAIAASLMAPPLVTLGDQIFWKVPGRGLGSEVASRLGEVNFRRSAATLLSARLDVASSQPRRSEG